MHERRERGLCYFCDDKYQTVHKCSRLKLYLLEGMEFEREGEEKLEEEEVLNPHDTKAMHAIQQIELLGISLHAIAGAPYPKTMRLVGKIGTSSVIGLNDNGSTHSFIDVNVAKKAKLPVEEGHLVVQVANRYTLPYLGCCKAVPLKMQHCHILANLFLIIVGGYGVGCRLVKKFENYSMGFCKFKYEFLGGRENFNSTWLEIT